MAFWVGVTGAIASGKSTIAHIFSKLNIPIINSDYIAKKITSYRGEALPILHHQLDKKYFLPNGSMDRKIVKQELFINQKFKEKIENILHPIILEKINMYKKKYNQYLYGLIEIPILCEKQKMFLPAVDRVLVIDISECNQIQRVTKRDNILECDATNIILNQSDRQQRNLIADDIIINDYNLDNLYNVVYKLHKFYVHFFTKSYEIKKNMF